MAFPLTQEEHLAIEARIDSQVELIVSAAVRYDGAIITFERPGRHGDCLNWLSRHRITRDMARDHGFLTNKGRYVGREEAGRIVQASGQGTPRLDPPGINPNECLFSEDMWNDPEDRFAGPINPATIF